MSLEQRILTLLHEEIGFNPESIGPEKLLSSVRAALSKKKIANPEMYLSGLRAGNAEFHEIVNAVVIPETWFFRDEAPFEHLKKHVLAEHLPAPGSVLRCLSVPCSTGEEPYSIAMALLDAGLSPRQFSIDAVDISSKSLERAVAGQYGLYSFRSNDLSFRDKYFQRNKNTYTLNKEVRATVHFSQANLLAPMFAHERPPYDIVFCRNLLIYFDAAGWAKATKALYQLLKDTGLLYTGHAELMNMNSTVFESVRSPLAFAYRKRPVSKQEKTVPARERPFSASSAKTQSKSSVPTAAATAGLNEEPRAKTAAHRLRRTTTKLRKLPAKSDPAPQTRDQLLDKATRLADQGELKQAAEICRNCLVENPACARSYFLLGLIAEVQGNAADAEHNYKRALYLDSKHQETMVHLALLLESRGDTVGAANLRKRASDSNRQR